MIRELWVFPSRGSLDRFALTWVQERPNDRFYYASRSELRDRQGEGLHVHLVTKASSLLFLKGLDIDTVRVFDFQPSGPIRATLHAQFPDATFVVTP